MPTHQPTKRACGEREPNSRPRDISHHQDCVLSRNTLFIRSRYIQQPCAAPAFRCHHLGTIRQEDHVPPLSGQERTTHPTHFSSIPLLRLGGRHTLRAPLYVEESPQVSKPPLQSCPLSGNTHVTFGGLRCRREHVRNVLCLRFHGSARVREKKTPPKRHAGSSRI